MDYSYTDYAGYKTTDELRLVSEPHLSFQFFNDTKPRPLLSNTLSYTVSENVTEPPPIQARGLNNVYTVVEIFTAVAAVIGI